MTLTSRPTLLFAAAAAILLAGCATAQTAALNAPAPAATSQTNAESDFEKDREAILAMAGNYRVTFDFIETVSFVEDYALKDRKLSGAHEIVRVIEDRGDFISLQHILVVGGDEKFPVKHWRQDWQYEPQSVLIYVGRNAWTKRSVGGVQANGKWSQTVYQVDDAPRYGALGDWSHEDGVSAWTPPAEWRPLPRRDATTRDDYHVVKAVNRHAITPDGWVHEQDNSKLVFGDEPYALVREIGVNTYTKFDDFDIAIGDDYWAATENFWADIRNEWARIETRNDSFGLTIEGEPEELYMKILGLADAVKTGEKTAAIASSEASIIIDEYTQTDNEKGPAHAAMMPARSTDLQRGM